MAKAKTKSEAPLRIVGLVAENFKRLVAVEIRPTGDVVEIVGPNEAGKSSVLDIISATLGGDGCVPEMPIRKGETEGFCQVDLGEMIVTRTFKLREDGKKVVTRLRVENADGFKASSPQTLIDGLLGKFAFDPQEFDRQKMKDKFETMKGLVPGVDFDAIAADDKADRDERTDVNRDAKALGAQIDAIVIPADAPTEKVDEAALVDEVASVAQHNADIETRKERRANARKEADGHLTNARSAMARAADLRRQADEAEAAAKKEEAEAVAIDKRLDEAPPLPDPKDVAEVRARLDQAKAVNAVVDLRARRETLEKQKAALDAKSAELTAAIEKRQAGKVAAIAAAKLPVEGLEFGDGVILLNGIPLDQCSAAQRLRTSVAIAMAANPRLRVLRINEGSLLDRKGMQIIAEMCEGRGYQAWVEKVSDDAKTGFIIEEGRLKGATAPTEGDKQAAD